MSTKLTKEQAVVLSAYTGFLMCDFSDMHAYIEKKLGRPIFTHELAFAGFEEKLREAAREDFMALLPEGVK